MAIFSYQGYGILQSSGAATVQPVLLNLARISWLVARQPSEFVRVTWVRTNQNKKRRRVISVG